MENLFYYGVALSAAHHHPWHLIRVIGTQLGSVWTVIDCPAVRSLLILTVMLILMESVIGGSFSIILGLILATQLRWSGPSRSPRLPQPYRDRFFGFEARVQQASVGELRVLERAVKKQLSESDAAQKAALTVQHRLIQQMLSVRNA